MEALGRLTFFRYANTSQIKTYGTIASRPVRLPRYTSASTFCLSGIPGHAPQAWLRAVAVYQTARISRVPGQPSNESSRVGHVPRAEGTG